MIFRGILLSIFSVFILGMMSVAQAGKPVLFAQVNLLSVEDLGIENPGLLPTNPFYFFKEWRRAISRATTFNSVAKMELEVNITNEKAAEVSKVAELSGTDTSAISKALRNYSDAQVRLREKLIALKETSQNPNLDRLLQDFTDKAVKHERLFDSLAQKFSDSKELVDLTESAKGTLEQSIVAAGEKDSSEKFSAKLEKSLLENTAGELKNSHAAVIIDRISEKSPENLKKSLENVFVEFSGKAQEDVSRLLEQKKLEELDALLKELPDSEQRQDFGAKIFYKQSEELSAPKPALMSLPVTPTAVFNAEIVICEQIKQNLDDIWDLFKGGKITEQEYRQKYDVLKTQYAGCESASSENATTTSVEVGGTTICTQQYDPVCGVDGKTYSNECVIKGSRVAIQYGGECKSLNEASTATSTTIEKLFSL